MRCDGALRADRAYAAAAPNLSTLSSDNIILGVRAVPMSDISARNEQRSSLVRRYSMGHSCRLEDVALYPRNCLMRNIIERGSTIAIWLPPQRNARLTGVSIV